MRQDAQTNVRASYFYLRTFFLCLSIRRENNKMAARRTKSFDSLSVVRIWQHWFEPAAVDCIELLPVDGMSRS